MNKNRMSAIFSFARYYIPVYECFIELVDDLEAGVLLSYLFFWCGRSTEIDGSVWKTADEFESVLRLKRRGLESARSILKQFKFYSEMREKRTGDVTPKIYYKIDFELLAKALTEMELKREPVCTKCTNRETSSELYKMKNSNCTKCTNPLINQNTHAYYTKESLSSAPSPSTTLTTTTQREAVALQHGLFEGQQEAEQDFDFAIEPEILAPEPQTLQRAKQPTKPDHTKQQTSRQTQPKERKPKTEITEQTQKAVSRASVDEIKEFEALPISEYGGSLKSSANAEKGHVSKLTQIQTVDFEINDTDTALGCIAKILKRNPKGSEWGMLAGDRFVKLLLAKRYSVEQYRAFQLWEAKTQSWRTTALSSKQLLEKWAEAQNWYAQQRQKLLEEEKEIQRIMNLNLDEF